jgi:hypothetical protein
LTPIEAMAANLTEWMQLWTVLVAGLVKKAARE